ncbi:hypothetical protein GCM10009563_25870 [Subtercola frigoramans]
MIVGSVLGGTSASAAEPGSTSPVAVVAPLVPAIPVAAVGQAAVSADVLAPLVEVLTPVTVELAPVAEVLAPVAEVLTPVTTVLASVAEVLTPGIPPTTAPAPALGAVPPLPAIDIVPSPSAAPAPAIPRTTGGGAARQPSAVELVGGANRAGTGIHRAGAASATTRDSAPAAATTTLPLPLAPASPREPGGETTLPAVPSSPTAQGAGTGGGSTTTVGGHSALVGPAVCRAARWAVNDELPSSPTFDTDTSPD